MQSILHKSPQPPASAGLEIAQQLARESGVGEQEKWDANRSGDFIHTTSRVETATEVQSDSSTIEKINLGKKKKLSLAPRFPLQQLKQEGSKVEARKLTLGPTNPRCS